MKNFKKVTAAIAATLMAATMAAPMAFNTFAAPVTEFTLSGVSDDLGIKDNKVYAYKLFDLVLSSDNTVTSIEWAANISDDVKDAIKSAVEVSSDTAADVATKITSDNSEAVARAIANEVAGTGAEGTYDGGKVTFTDGLSDGYYLCTCVGTKDVLGTTQESISLGMLTIANGAVTTNNIGTGTAKIGLPTVEKKVLEDDVENTAAEAATYESDKHWNDVADLEIGQEAKFGLYGTLPENYDNYENYYYEFVDHLDGVFVKPEVSKFTVTSNDDSITDADYTITVTGDETAGYDINVVFANLKTNDSVKATTQITVKYTTALTDAAKVCSVNPNEVSLKYSNNPNKSGTGEFDKDENEGETPKDKVGIYTYDFQFEKKFFNAGSDLTEQEIKDGNYSKLKFGVDGKKFREVTEDDTDLYGVYDYVMDENGTVTDLSLKIIDADGNLVDASTITEDSDVKGYKLVVRIKGLDSDKYAITEDNTDWEEYNAISAAEGAFEIETSLELKQDESKFADVTETYDKNKDNYFEVDNTKGTKLPSTGGVGTTLFYLGGGAMVAVAGVFLITKKRMKKNEA
ncbi:MAG: LPXTG cell wall anchor domain-containing protein [Ruminococcus flavefaciens]|nr:LPXTG cell wall anchor domain-containing protein [Ruminococcus flavefaciens]MCM1229373.1 LPXTG cell wall anchor domain-containing protein [Ruminococcus flavefaciens]